MAESDLHTRVLQTKLTPNLAQLLPPVKEELDFVLAEEFSKLGKGELADQDALLKNTALIKDTTDEWSEVCLNEIILRVVARISARVFVGEELCRDKEWLRLSVKYTEDVFMVILTLRFFYPWMRPFVAAVLPAVWRVRADVRKAKKIMVPVINESRRLAREKPGMGKPMTLLQWMVDAANEQEGKPEKLAHRQLLLSLASIHTTTMATLHALYDMCSMPEYYEPLREEIVEVLTEDKGWQKSSLNKMRKMDSFMRESQRFSASSLREYLLSARAILAGY
jgi:ent-kaurene oxidase